jgi:hypothetical protein
VPATNPETTPEGLTVATDVVTLVQLPPEVASVSEVVLPAHTYKVPEMEEGNEFTLTVKAVPQPVRNV